MNDITHELARALRGIVGGAERQQATSAAQSRAHMALAKYDRMVAMAEQVREQSGSETGRDG